MTPMISVISALETSQTQHGKYFKKFNLLISPPQTIPFAGADQIGIYQCMKFST